VVIGKKNCFVEPGKGLDEALDDGTLSSIGATYSHENNVIYDTVYRDGPKLINFSGVLKYDSFPLAGLLSELLSMGVMGMGVPVEMEFAVALNKNNNKRPEMAVLQMRPLVASGVDEEVALTSVSAEADILLEGKALGNGITKGLKDIIYIHPNRFKMENSKQYAQEIASLNHKLAQEKRKYILIGPGRWGSSDPWLGIPVAWTQVSSARVIVEFQLRNIPIDPSQGTHFFHNLTSLRVGYFNIDPHVNNQTINFNWLEKQPVFQSTEAIRHIRLKHSLEALIDGRKGWGMVAQHS